jgi:hypothetical protein
VRASGAVVGSGVSASITGTNITPSSIRRAFRSQQQQQHGPVVVLDSREEDDLML